MTKYKVNDVDAIFIPDQIGLGNYQPTPNLEIQTTDATPTLTLTSTFPNDGIYQSCGLALASTADGSDWAIFSGHLLDQQVIISTLGVLSSSPALAPVSPFHNAGPTSATWLVIPAIVGNTVTFTIQGAAGVTINWSLNQSFYTNTIA